MNSSVSDTTLDAALGHIRQQLIDGLRHGFFELTVICEIVKGQKRRLVIKAGKSEQFLITPEELNVP